MNTQNKKDRFLELRIQGETFDSIAKELEVSKQTLINWSKEPEIQEAISMASSVRVQAILKEYELLRNNKIEYYSALSKKVREELEKTDFSKVKTDKLINILIKCESKINDLVIKRTFGGGDIFDDMLNQQTSFYFDPED